MVMNRRAFLGLLALAVVATPAVCEAIAAKVPEVRPLTEEELRTIRGKARKRGFSVAWAQPRLHDMAIARWQFENRLYGQLLNVR